MKNKTVAIIGGGLGALSGAIRLARMGFSVQLFEKNAKLGGKMNETILGDYRFDTGPSLLTMPFVIDELFDFAGFKRSDYDRIDVEQTYTPEDFCTLYASNRGSIYGISSNSKTTAFKRPPNRSRMIDGLYFAGGSVHPGGGIPLVILSGKMAAELIDESSF